MGMVTAKVTKNSMVSTTVNSTVNSTVSSAVNSAANAIVNSTVSSAVNSTESSAMIRNHVDPKDLKDPKMMTSISTLKTKRTLISTLETIRTLISRTISQQREEREKRKEVPNSSKRNVKEKKD